jgi:hypothetical protein
MKFRVVRLALPALLALPLVLAACGDGDSDDHGGTPPGGEGVIVTFRVADSEEYRIRLVEQEDVDIARKLLAGEEAPGIPNGKIVRGSTDVNTGYSWHIDPNDIEFAELTMEVCDGLPSYVEDGTITSERFCPWMAKVIAIDEQ